MVRLLVVDQRLHGFEGHHFDLSRSIIEAAMQADCMPFLAPRKDFPFDKLAGTPVLGRFSTRTNTQSLAHELLRKIPTALRHRLLTIMPRPQQTRPVANTRFAHDLVTMVQGLDWTAQDHILVHTIDQSELLGLAEVLPSTNKFFHHLHLVLRYDGAPEITAAFERLNSTKLRVHYWTDTKELAEHYRELGCPDIGVLPIPHGLGDIPQRAIQPNHPLTISYLGGARRDKGFHLLPSLVASLANDYLATGRARFLIQTTFGISRDEGLMAATKRALSSYPTKWVELIETEPDSVTFRKHLLASDLILLPYDRETYQRRSSGLLVQAIAAGIPAVVPENTWLSTSAPKEAQVAYRDDLVGAVRMALANYPALLTQARAQMKPRQALHNAERLVDTLLRASHGA